MASQANLFNFFMYSDFLHDRVELLQLETLRRVLLVLGSNIPACAWKSAGFMLGAFHDDLHSAALFCHYCKFIKLLG